MFTHYQAASSRSVLSYKFTSQTLTTAGVSCVCSLGSCLFGKQEMLQCQGEGWLHRLPGKGPEMQRSWSKTALLRTCLLEAISFLTLAPKEIKPSKQLPSCLSISVPLSSLSLPVGLFISYLQAYPLYLITNFATEKVVVLATSPLGSNGVQA